MWIFHYTRVVQDNYASDAVIWCQSCLFYALRKANYYKCTYNEPVLCLHGPSAGPKNVTYIKLVRCVRCEVK